ncbi:hypothetical protein HPB50_004594 [Hyalomma asiaticum]|uniref:Uncharacterized protein n=1 Tax=Hyalomma asiaticum TaxID=266040 RepID=A0ACB7TEG9_HYAAI|nr:hypothetical protein HPB50_004594 [Hyalomma asiaticum]
MRRMQTKADARCWWTTTRGISSAARSDGPRNKGRQQQKSARGLNGFGWGSEGTKLDERSKNADEEEKGGQPASSPIWGGRAALPPLLLLAQTRFLELAFGTVNTQRRKLVALDGDYGTPQRTGTMAVHAAGSPTESEKSVRGVQQHAWAKRSVSARPETTDVAEAKRGRHKSHRQLVTAKRMAMPVKVMRSPLITINAFPVGALDGLSHALHARKRHPVSFPKAFEPGRGRFPAGARTPVTAHTSIRRRLVCVVPMETTHLVLRNAERSAMY